MKKPQVICLIIIAILLPAFYNCSQTKSSPGLYVNDWPPFSVSYPLKWEEKEPDYPTSVFRVDSPDGSYSFWSLVVPYMEGPIKDSPNVFTEGLKGDGAKDVKLIYGKEVQLNDGTLAYETEFECFFEKKQTNFYLTIKEWDTWIIIAIISQNGKISEELKKTAYTLRKGTVTCSNSLRVYLIITLPLLIVALVFTLLPRKRRSVK